MFVRYILFSFRENRDLYKQFFRIREKVGMKPKLYCTEKNVYFILIVPPAFAFFVELSIKIFLFE